ncbi:hypothetical protein B296_00022710 [Ensete ventricosum]|uniref:Uncharacterized protein n=1 Tax=Ensete ventricosum TaxID=4639 RepID=A0A427AB46_ENSVE|nr:hypothetical protein B296_00022710 [Ensete ventricosum]
MSDPRRASLFSYPNLSDGNMPVQTVSVFGRKTSDHSPRDNVEDNHFIAAKTLIVEKREEQKRPRTEQPRGPTSGPSRRRIEGSDFSRSQPPTTPLNSTSRLTRESVRPVVTHGSLDNAT